MIIAFGSIGLCFCGLGMRKKVESFSIDPILTC